MKNNTFNIKVVTYCAIILGWLLSGYLMYRSNHLKSDLATIPDLCNMFFGFSCDKALSSRISWHLGYPLAGWGLFYFGLIGLLLSLNKPFIDRLLIFIAAFGVGVSIFQVKIIFDGHIPCPFCLCIHFINLLSLLSLIMNTRTAISVIEEPVKTAKNNIMSLRGTWLLRGVFILSTIALGGFMAYNALKYSLNKQNSINLEEISKNFQSEKVYTIPKTDASPIIGSPTAPIQLVVFSSFQCPACKSFAPSLENIHKKYGDKVGITFKNFPLSKTCNPQLSEDMQPQACEAAFAAKAAQLQNKFWNYHDEIFKSNLEIDDTALSLMAKNIGLNTEKFAADKKSEVIKASIADDVNIGYQLAVDRTPTVFINGKRVNNAQENVLDFLIQNELNKG